jgi:hypothetical protein
VTQEGGKSKRELLASLMPLAALVPLTEEASHALPNEMLKRGLVGIHGFPFRIGRESRIVLDEKTGLIHRMERYKPGRHAPNNDLYLIDDGQLLNVSREHLSIEKRDNEFVVVDRKSACGFSVDGKHFGGDGKGGTCPIEDEQVLTLGAAQSPFRFRFVNFSAAKS